MKSFRIIAPVCALLVCVSCTNLKGTRLTAGNKSKVLAQIGTGNQLTDAERHLLVEYSMRCCIETLVKTGKPDLPTGKTIGEMIDEQRKWDAEHPPHQ